MDYVKSLLNYTITHEEVLKSKPREDFHQYTLEINLRRWNSIFYKKTFNYHLNLVRFYTDSPVYRKLNCSCNNSRFQMEFARIP